MATDDTEVTICSHALQLLGESAISSFADGTTSANLSAELYPHTRDSLLVKYPWSWSIKKVDLARSATAPVNEFSFAYPMPSDSLTGVPRAVFNSSDVGASPITTGWEVYEQAIITDQENITIDYQFRPLEQVMPSYFVQLLKYVMASILAEPVTDQTQKAAYFQQLAYGSPAEGGRGGYFRQAAAVDGMGSGTSFIQDFPLIDTRLTLA